jgi:NADH-quinone oxidoreductase subunit L
MATIILFAPLVGAILCGFGWRIIGEKAGQVLTTSLVFLAAILSWIVFLTFDGETQHIHILNWIQSGSLSSEWSIRLDRMTAIMLVVVNSVSALVHLYSFGYMAHDENWREGEHYKARFFAYLSFFTFAMLMLVTSDNLVQMFFGWEGVGVASYLLIGFYYRKPSANAAAIKAFVVNRVGDFGFALGIMALFFLTDSIRFDDVFAAAPALAETNLSFLWTEWNAANLIGVLLFIGAMGKSAQLILHTWLPDAMEGPTPVSALIHAATMVTAGVFLVCRMSPLYEYAPSATAFITVLGATTAFFAATVGLVQNDIKRVIAYSTCSQLGYMFVAAGRRRLSGRHVPPVHPRLLQGDAVPGGGVGDPRHPPRAGHAQLWRPAEEDPADLLGDDDRHAGHHRRRHPADPLRLCRLPVEGCGDRKRLGRVVLCLCAAGRRGLLYQLLFLAADVPDLLRDQPGPWSRRAWPRP